MKKIFFDLERNIKQLNQKCFVDVCFLFGLVVPPDKVYPEYEYLNHDYDELGINISVRNTKDNSILSVVIITFYRRRSIYVNNLYFQCWAPDHRLYRDDDRVRYTFDKFFEKLTKTQKDFVIRNIDLFK